MNRDSAHRIEQVRYSAETIECICGEVIVAEPDLYVHDRHGPLCEAWAAHRSANGLTFGTRGSSTGPRPQLKRTRRLELALE